MDRRWMGWWVGGQVDRWPGVFTAGLKRILWICPWPAPQPHWDARCIAGFTGQLGTPDSLPNLPPASVFLIHEMATSEFSKFSPLTPTSNGLYYSIAGASLLLRPSSTPPASLTWMEGRLPTGHLPSPALSLHSSCCASNPREPSCLCLDQLSPDLCKAQPPLHCRLHLNVHLWEKRLSTVILRAKIFLSQYFLILPSTGLHQTVIAIPLPISFPAPPHVSSRSLLSPGAWEFWHIIGMQDINRKKFF